MGTFILFLQLSGLKLGQNKKKLKGENKSERMNSQDTFTKRNTNNFKNVKHLGENLVKDGQSL